MMSPWDTLPWNTILLIIGGSLLTPSVIAILFIKIKRYEDVGLAIGIFLLILGSVSLLYLIPQVVITDTKLPENYLWEDTGAVHYWERNGLFLKGRDQRHVPFIIQWFLPDRAPIEKDFLATEVIHVSEFQKGTNKALIHDVIYDNNGDVLSVINQTQKVSEWYWINAHTMNLSYLNVNAGRMGIPAIDRSINTIKVGWVESNGEQNGKESIVLVRDMQRIKNGYIKGVEVSVWRSDIYNKEITWHGETYYCDETLQLTVNPSSGYVVHVYRHLVLSAHLSEFLRLYYPTTMHSRIFTNLLKINNPIGEAAELTYNTTADSMNIHLAAVRDINMLMTYVPFEVCIPIISVGAALTWRFFGRSYYWKRYREYEQIPGTSKPKKRTPSNKKILVIGICSLLLISVLGYFVYQNTMLQKTDMQIPAVIIESPIEGEQNEPTPPGTNRIIDSGRHVLQLADEGFHKGSRREWWYYNVFFNDPDSDLQGYSMIVSFNQMKFFDVRFLRPDNLFILLFDDTGHSYQFSTFNKRRGTLQATTGSGADVTFESSWTKGAYPFWQIHAVNEEQNFIADLEFTADFLPVWVEGRSANLPLISLATGGDYYVPRCKVTGNISWQGERYQVAGIGYHDHVWQSIVPRWVSPGWDWANLHFDNGWEMYVSKFRLRAPFDLSFDSIIVSPNNRNITEFNHFEITYIETATPKGLPLMKYPKKMHIEAERDDIILNLDVEVINTAENVWRFARTGMFEGPCIATGTLSWSGYTVELNGYGLSEFTRVKYFLGLRDFFQK